MTSIVACGIYTCQMSYPQIARFFSPDKGRRLGVAFSAFFCYIIAMPITQSAKKAIRGSLRKKAFNDRRMRVMKEIIKKIILGVPRLFSKLLRKAF